MSDCDLDKVSSYQRWKLIQSENIEALESVRLPAINQSTSGWTQQPYYGSDGEIGSVLPRYYYQPHSPLYSPYIGPGPYWQVPAVTKNVNFGEESKTTSQCPRVAFETSDDCKTSVNFIQLNKRKMIGKNMKKFIYPPKSYTEMYAKKRQSDIGYTNCNNRNIFGGTSTFLPFAATNTSRSGVDGLQPTRDKVKHAHFTQFPVQQHTMQATTTRASHLPAITATQSQSTTAGLQKVNIDINLRLADDQQVGKFVVNGTPQLVSPRRLEPLQQSAHAHWQNTYNTSQ